MDATIFRGSSLDSATLYKVSAISSTFDSTSLSNADIRGSDLSSSSFRSASLNESVFSANICQDCDFRDADLLNVDIRNTNFTGSEFSDGGYFTWDYPAPYPVCGVTDINGRIQNSCGYEYDRTSAH